MLFRSEPAKLSVLEQNYEYDLLDPQKLLQKYVGREVGFNWNGVEMTGLLLADNNGPIWKVNNQIITGLPVGTFHFPELPDNLYSRPTLVWMLDNRGANAQKVEASYLAGNMNWSADYVLTVSINQTLLSSLVQLTPGILSLFQVVFTSPGVLDLPAQYSYVCDI